MLHAEAWLELTRLEALGGGRQFYKTLSGKGNKDSNRHFENYI
jgi:hypothetical protein